MTDSLLVVKPESPVQDTASKLYRWDVSARKYHAEFEASIAARREGLGLLFKNPLTSFRDPIHFGGRYAEIQTLKLRQQLGDISPSEVQEANKSLFNGAQFVTSRQDAKGTPAKLYALNVPLMGGALGLGGAFCMYAKFVRGAGVLWLVGSVLPFATMSVYNHARQPEQHLLNCYNYILQKRVASVELEANQQEWQSQDFVKSSEYGLLQGSLGGKTLY